MLVMRTSHPDYPIEVIDSEHERINLDRWLLENDEEWSEFLIDLARERQIYLNNFSKKGLTNDT